MSIVTSIKEALSGGSPSRTGGESGGSYWCDDCGERLPDADADAKPPDCPDCGATMRFERASPEGCAC